MAKEEKKGFTIIANEVIEMNLPPVEKTILIVLLRYNNSKIGYSFPSYTTLTEKKGFTIIANEVIEMNLPPVEKTILIVLLRYNNSKIGYSFPSYTTLTEKCCISKKTVIKALNNLEKKGIIKKECLKGKGNKYFITDFENYTSVETTPVEKLHQCKNYTSVETAPHRCKNYTSLVENLHPINTNINTNTKVETTPVEKLHQCKNYTSVETAPHRCKNYTSLVENLHPINTNINTNTKDSSNSKELEPTSNISKKKKTKKKTKKVFEPDSIEYQLSKKLYEYVLKEKPYTKKNDDNFQKWSKEFDLIFRIDKRKVEEVEKVIDWIFNGTNKDSNFWKRNISSPGALRGETKNGADKFATVYAAMEDDKSFKFEQNNLKEDIEPYSIEEMLKPI